MLFFVGCIECVVVLCLCYYVEGFGFGGQVGICVEGFVVVGDDDGVDVIICIQLVEYFDQFIIYFVGESIEMVWLVQCDGGNLFVNFEVYGVKIYEVFFLV